jgi:cell division protein FtsB
MGREAHVGLPDAARARRRVRLGLTFVAAALAVNAVLGERGLGETLRARREGAALTVSISKLRLENARLREDVRRLKEDPTLIETLARRDLGLMRPGEILFVFTPTR